MAFTPLSAKNAKVRINSTVFTAKVWSATPKAPGLDVANFEGAGYGEYRSGLVDLDVTIEADQDGAQNPWDSPINVKAGSKPAVKLYLNGTDGPYWDIPALYIEQAPNRAAVRETVGLQIQGKGSGAFVYPTGTTSN